jgi:hypothetical protein
VVAERWIAQIFAKEILYPEQLACFGCTLNGWGKEVTNFILRNFVRCNGRGTEVTNLILRNFVRCDFVVV